MKRGGIRRKRLFGRTILLTSLIFFIGFGLLLLTLRSVDPNSSFIDDDDDDAVSESVSDEESARWSNSSSVGDPKVDGARLCATVEEMGNEFDGGFVDQSLRVRHVIRRHFHVNGEKIDSIFEKTQDFLCSEISKTILPCDENDYLGFPGASAIRELPPEQFCRHGYVLGKTAEAGFGNEMYKILTSGALSIMLNRSLIIGQTRHILVLSQSFFFYFLGTILTYVQLQSLTTSLAFCLFYFVLSVCLCSSLHFFLLRGKYPFGDYIAYSNATFTMNEVKHLWRQKGCVKKYRKRLVMRLDDFEKPAKSNVLCSNWKKWEQPIIWSVRIITLKSFVKL